jgi:hypothetical protein
MHSWNWKHLPLAATAGMVVAGECAVVIGWLADDRSSCLQRSPSRYIPAVARIHSQVTVFIFWIWLFWLMLLA